MSDLGRPMSQNVDSEMYRTVNIVDFGSIGLAGMIARSEKCANF
jgi:hypothetical protein